MHLRQHYYAVQSYCRTESVLGTNSYIVTWSVWWTAFVEYVEVTTSTENKWDVLYTGFVSFVEDLASRDDTWRFWHDFLFHDCLAYVGLYLATRGGMWNLQMASLKEMCPLFTAFDRLNYMTILPQHFAEVMALPEEIRHCSQVKRICVIAHICATV